MDYQLVIKAIEDIKLNKQQKCETRFDMAKIIAIETFKKLKDGRMIEVVRCGECKYNTSEKKCLYPDSIIKTPKDNDYCSYGER